MIMKNLISDEKILISVDDWKNFKAALEDEVDPDDYGGGMDYVIDKVDEWLSRQQKVDSNAIAQGHWIRQIGDFKCSVCGSEEEYVTNYCPECGAKLEGVCDGR